MAQAPFPPSGAAADFCARMECRAAAFPEKVFGNAHWNILAGRKPGEMTFFTPSPGETSFVENLFRLRCSFLAPVSARRAVYRPDVYRMETETPEGTASASLVFPPGRYGAILYVEGPERGAVVSQFHLFTSNRADPDSSLYPDYDAASRTFSFRRAGLHVMARLRVDALAQVRVQNGWQSARVGVDGARSYALLLAVGRFREEAEAELAALGEGLADWSAETTAWWNGYFASCPLVLLREATPVPGLSRTISPAAFAARQLWMYYWCLLDVVETSWARATPLQVADRFRFNQSFSNDNVFGIELLSLTNRSDRARTHLVSLVRHLIDGEGHLHWSISIQGRCSTYAEPHGVPAIAHAVAHYVRCTGDEGILEEDAGGRTLWEKLKLYHRRLPELRDTNGDGLIEWNHIWETGEDNKNSPFFRNKGLLEWVRFYDEQTGRQLEQNPFYRENVCPVTSLNEQTFHLWSLDGMAFLAPRKGEAPEPYRRQAEEIRRVVSARHWDEGAGFYFDYDAREQKLWPAKNLSAFYFLYFEQDPARASRMIGKLADPRQFGLTLLPSLSFDDPQFDPESYWSGAAWPREQGFVALGLARQGFLRDAFELMLRTIASEEGFDFSEVVDPLCAPVESHGSIDLAMCSVNQVVLLELCGLKTWEGTRSIAETGLPVSLLHL